MHTLSAGLLATDPDGCILAANRAAQTLLHGLPISPGKRFGDVFRTRFSSFLEEGRRHERQKLQDEVGSHAWLADSPALALDDEQRDGIRRLAAAVKALPPQAVAPPGAYMESSAGCLQAMRHPAWAPLRREAAQLAEQLEEAFNASEDFLYPD